MINKELSIDLICEITKLTKEEVNQIIKKKKYIKIQIRCSIKYTTYLYFLLNKKLTIIIEKNKENNYNKIDKRKERVKTKKCLGKEKI